MDGMTEVTSDLAAIAAPAYAASVFPTTISQRAAWAQDRARPGDSTLNIAARWRLEGTVAIGPLERSLQALVERHEPLRTAFILRGGIPAQRVLPAAPLRLDIVDLLDWDVKTVEDEATRLAREEASKPFDLSRPPLLRATLVRLQRQLADLLVTTHTCVSDCWSNGTLARETVANYEAFLSGRTSDLPELSLQFGDYARWQERWLAEGGADTALAYWRGRLDRMPAFHVPTDHPVPLRPSGEGDILGMPVPDALAKAAQAAASRQGATFFILGVAAMAVVLYRWTGAKQVILGTQVAGRPEFELEPLVGPFANTVSLLVDVIPSGTFSALLDTVREVVGEALEHSAAPFDLVTKGAKHVMHRRDPRAAVNFLIQRAFTRDAPDSSLTLRGVPNFSPGSKHDLNVFLVERPAGWRASCEYDPELFDRKRIDWLLRSLLEVLASISEDTAQRVSTIVLPRMHEPLENAAAPATVVYDACDASAESARGAIQGEHDVDGEVAQLTTRLALLWATVLRIESVPEGANFFELGGDSIRAARLLALVDRTFGRRISMGQLFKHPTLPEIALLLRGETERVPPDDGVVAVQPLGHRPPIFAINNTGIFYTLSRHLGSDQPFMAVQSLDPSASTSLHPTDFRDVGARYVEAIRRIRPHGPYALIGLCVAGKVALEVAHQLTAAGESVPLLAVVDTWAPGHLQRMGMGKRALATFSLRLVRLRRQLSRIRGGTLSLRGFLANRAAVRRTRNAIFELLRRYGICVSVPVAVQNNLFVDYLDGAARAYIPPPYTGRVLVFYGPEQPRGRFLDPSFGWKDLVTGNLNVVPVPAEMNTQFVDHHQGLFRDAGALLMARHIASALD